MGQPTTLLQFGAGGQQHALPLDAVEHVSWAVEITPIPEAPPAVVGAVNMAGVVVPVISLRRLVHLPDREVEPSDRLVVIRLACGLVALVVDEVVGVVVVPDCGIAPAGAMGSGGSVQGLLSQADGLVLVHDIERLLRPADMESLARVVGAGAEEPVGAEAL